MGVSDLRERQPAQGSPNEKEGKPTNRTLLLRLFLPPASCLHAGGSFVLATVCPLALPEKEKALAFDW
jgi:hypothetical protein